MSVPSKAMPLPAVSPAELEAKRLKSKLLIAKADSALAEAKDVAESLSRATANYSARQGARGGDGEKRGRRP